MSESLVRASRATLVHSEFARRAVLQRSPDATVFRAPLGLTLPDFVDRSRARAILRIPDDQFLIASITHISPYKRIDVVLRAFRQLRNSTPARLILAGSVSPNFPLFRMVAHLGLDQVVDTPGYVSDQDARLIAAAADVTVNLRYPTAGETSASLLHSMAAGRPVLVSETGSFTEVPADAVIRIPVDALEESMLLAILRRLAEDKQLAEAIGRRARDYVETRHSMQRWVNGYCEAIEAITGMEVRRPVVENHYEAVITGRPEIQHYQTNELTREIARDITELGLGADEDLMSEIARAHVELGLGVGMISEDP